MLVRNRSSLRSLLPAAGLLCLAGCHGLFNGWSPSDAPLPVDPHARPPAAAPARPASIPALADAGWIRTPSNAAATANGNRWRHTGLDELVSRPAAERPDFHAALADADPVVATNAAIALARLGDAAGAKRLAAAVAAAELKAPFRCAAAEALGRIAEPSPAAALTELLQKYGHTKVQDRVGYLPELHAELLRALARHAAPAVAPPWSEALASAAVEVRLAGVSAWSEHPQTIVPAEVVALRRDRDPRVRAATLELLAQRRLPQAAAWLSEALGDLDLNVRLAAIAGLGSCGGEEARAALVRLQSSPHERLRAAAVAALSTLGQRGSVTEASADHSWLVRAAVADSLACNADAEGVQLAIRLVQDESIEVERRAVAAVHAWPLPLAGPVLLAALEANAYTTRRQAAEQLTNAWSPAAEFPVDGADNARKLAIARLRERFGREVAALPATSAAAAPGRVAGESPAQALRSELLPQVQRAVETLEDAHAGEAACREAAKALSDLGPDLVPLLTHLSQQRLRPLPEAVYRDVLPPLNPVFAAVEGLNSHDVQQRRRAADALADQAAQRPLPALAVARIAQRVTTESDVLVWRGVLTALAGDGSEPALRLAYAGVSHPSAEVRRGACANLAAHPDPRHASVLLPMLDERNPAVLAAAVEALGLGGHVDDCGSLRRLLTAPQEPLRLEVAMALARLGDPFGPPALQRMAHAGDAGLRRQAALAMGSLGDRLYVDTLIGLLDDRATVRQAAFDSLAKLEPSAAESIEHPPPVNSEERARRWQQWYRHQEVRTEGWTAKKDAPPAKTSR